MSVWLLLKQCHIALALISITGFTLRGGLMLVGASLLERRWVKRLPHVIDTLLFATGISLAWHTAQYPFTNSYWLTAKMLALLAYIAFGMLALGGGRGKALRIIAYIAALLCAGYILNTATTRNPLVAI